MFLLQECWEQFLQAVVIYIIEALINLKICKTFSYSLLNLGSGFCFLFAVRLFPGIDFRLLCQRKKSTYKLRTEYVLSLILLTLYHIILYMC